MNPTTRRGLTLFPVVAVSHRITTAGILADPDAPPCAPLADVNTRTWRWVTVKLPVVATPSIGVLVPSGAGESGSHDSAMGVPDTEEHWQQLVASWTWADSDKSANDARKLAIWFGSIEAYPAVGEVSGTQQRDLHECLLLTEAGPVHAAMFCLEPPRQPPAFYLSAYAALGTGLWLGVLGRGPDEASQQELLASLGTLRPKPQE